MGTFILGFLYCISGEESDKVILEQLIVSSENSLILPNYTEHSTGFQTTPSLSAICPICLANKQLAIYLNITIDNSRRRNSKIQVFLYGYQSVFRAIVTHFRDFWPVPCYIILYLQICTESGARAGQIHVDNNFWYSKFRKSYCPCFTTHRA